MQIRMLARLSTRAALGLVAAALLAGATMLSSGVAQARPAQVAAVAEPAALNGHWTFDEGSGTTAADSSGGGHPLALMNGAGWGRGLIGPGSLSLNGNGQYAQSAGPVIDTTQSFSVSVWVNLSNTNGYQTFVSQDGTNVSGFYLQLRGDSHRFAFTRIAYDSTQALGIIASADSIIPQPGVWYHLTGVYDAQAQTISLYVNGTLQQTQSFVPNWSAGGSLAVGRSLYGGNHVDFVSGLIDDVRTYSGVLTSGQIAALAGPGRLVLDAAQAGPTINSTQFGEFLEEINHSGDGGLYAELIRNRDLKEDASQPVAYSAIAEGGATDTIGLDQTQPLNSANPVSLKLQITKLPAGGRAGVANAGYWGIPVKPSTTYRVSLFAKSATATSTPLNVDLESTSGHVWATTRIGPIGTTWKQYTATLTTPGGIPATLTNRFVVSTSDPAAAGQTIWLTFMSLFPPTYDNTANGLRVDLMKKLAALRPGYMRVPGGNYLEGETIDTRFDWSTTIGPVQDRPGHFDSAWGYWSQDGMGLLEYLELAEELHAQPVLAVWAGYTLNGTVVPQSQLAPYVQSALDEIQYAIGSTATKFGAMRAADGHPAPFNLKIVEIGNEDFFDSTGSYNAYRYPMFYDALKAAYPQLKLMATTTVTSRPMDVIDEHFYNNDPDYFAENAHLFDGVSRSGPKVLVGEYATTQGVPTGTLAGALGESAFLTGLERNADLVLGASYAPLLVNVNAPSWPTNLIGYDALHSYGSPSYWAQRMLSAGHGTQVIGSQLVAGTGTLFVVSSRAGGHTYLDVVNDGSSAARTHISLTGEAGARHGVATVLTGDPTAMNSLSDPRAVSPRTHGLGGLGNTFTYTFAPNSVTVLDLSTAAGMQTASPLATPAASHARLPRPGHAGALKPLGGRGRHHRK